MLGYLSLDIVQFQNISILPPTEGIGISWGVGGSVRPKNLKKCMKLKWNFQRGGGSYKKIPSVGEVWIFSAITHYGIIFLKAYTFPQASLSENNLPQSMKGLL